MRDLTTRLLVTLASIDDANAADPNLIDGRPLARVQGQRASAWLDELASNPSDALAIAVRAHHLRRWELRRIDFPDGRHGYLRWRRVNKKHQAEQAVAIASEHGYDAAILDRLAELLNRRGLGSDPETQVVEDAACLVFLGTQFEPMLERLERDHLTGVVAKTLAKMSRRAIELSSRIELSPEAAEIVREAARSHH